MSTTPPLVSATLPATNAPVLTTDNQFTLPWRKALQRMSSITNNAGVVLLGNTQNTSYTLNSTDAGLSVDHNSTGAVTYTIPASQFPLGALINLDNGSAVTGILTVAPGAGVTLLWAVGGASGTRHIAAGGVATLRQSQTNIWKIWGTGIS